MSIRFPARAASRACVRHLLATALTVLPAACLAASDVPIADPGFGGSGDGIARVPFDIVANGNDVASAAVVADGKLVLAGTAQVGADSYDIAFTRLGADGQPDPDFGGGGRVLGGLAPVGYVTDLKRTADGHLLYVAATPPLTSAIVGRLNGDGTPDTSFNVSGHRFLSPGFFADDGAFVALLRAVALADGKMLLIGFVAPSPDQYCVAVARLAASGGTDTSFGAGRGSICIAPSLSGIESVAQAADATVLDDGRILIAGTARHPGGSGLDMSVTRLLPDGELDTSFGPGHDGWAYVGFDQGGDQTDAAWALAVDSADRIVIAGIAQQPSGYDIGVARLLPSGETDPTFGLDGRRQLGLDLSNLASGYHAYALSGGRVLIGGGATFAGESDSTGLAAMLTPGGQLDPRFGDGGLFRQAAAGAPTSAVVDTQNVMLDGDHLYMVGGNRNTTSDRSDFAATRVVLPLFRDGFD